MILTTTPKVADLPHFSKSWAAARVARRLCLRYTAPIAGRRVAGHLEHHAASTHPQWAFRWVYWNVVLAEIERRCGYRFPVRRSA